MTLILELNPEIERDLAAQASERGLSLDQYVQEIVTHQARRSVGSKVDNGITEIPALHLGRVMGSLHRSDLYDDVR